MWDLLACIVGIYAFFLTWGVMQERVVSTSYGNDDKFCFYIVLNCVQAAVASIVALVYTTLMRRQKMPFLGRALTKRFLYLGFLVAIASPFGYQSLKHLNYVALTLAKSCKLLPIMAMNKLLYGRKYPFYKYVVIFMVTAGVSSFMLYQPSKKGKATASSSTGGNSMLGFLLILINLSLDGVVSSTQDQIFAEAKHIRGEHMMCYLNFFSCLLMVGWLLNPWNPELSQAIVFLSAHPQALTDIGLFAICGAIGQCFIYYMLAHFGSLVLTTVTVTRKLFTILLSIVKFNHSLSIAQWWSIVCVFTGIGIEAYFKRKPTTFSTTSTKSEPVDQAKEQISPKNDVEYEKSAISSPTKHHHATTAISSPSSPINSIDSVLRNRQSIKSAS